MTGYAEVLGTVVIGLIADELRTWEVDKVGVTVEVVSGEASLWKTSDCEADVGVTGASVDWISAVVGEDVFFVSGVDTGVEGTMVASLRLLVALVVIVATFEDALSGNWELAIESSGTEVAKVEDAVETPPPLPRDGVTVTV